jgi:hypothetical protein
MKYALKWAVNLTLTLPIAVHAFGLGEIVGAGLQVGGKLIGAGIDKAKDAMRDPEAEARRKREEDAKMVAEFQKAIDAVESRPGLTPLQREKAVMTIQKSFAMVQAVVQMQEQAEANRRAQSDRIFSAQGLAGLAGDAAMGAVSNRMAIAQADAMVKAGIPQAQSKAALAQVDGQAIMNAQLKSNSVMREVDKVLSVNPLQLDPKPLQAATDLALSQEVKIANLPSANPSVTADHQPTLQTNAFTPDLGKKVCVLFDGAPNALSLLKKQLLKDGHALEDDPTRADVIFRIEGEYLVPESKQFSGTQRSLATILESDNFLWTPEKKLMGSIGAGLGQLVLGMAAAQGSQVPKELLNSNPAAIQQSVMLVVSREPRDGKATRISASKSLSSEKILAKSMSEEVYGEMLTKLGLDGRL